MSTSYNLEPPPTGKVLLQTTSGDILLELFAKQTPLTSRNFIQLCLDGYYVGTIFHRLVPGFIIQGGDPTGTGEGGESIYDDGQPFADEFHSRLKFNRRGLLGMANGGKKDDNASQFFLTLGKTEELNGKNTMFGRVVGDTIYNLMKMGEAELVDEEGSERPLYPTKITGTEVLVNPFEGMVKRELSRRAAAPDAGKGKDQGTKKKKAGKKAGKTLLSFGGDEGEEGDGPLPLAKKAKFNPKLINETSADGVAANGHGDGRLRPAVESIKEAPAVTSPAPSKHRQHQTSVPEALTASKPVKAPSPSPSPETEPVAAVSSLLDKTNAQIADLKASMKRTIQTHSSSLTATKKSALEQMIPETSIRGRKRKHGATSKGGASSAMSNLDNDDRRALDLFNAFRAKLDSAAPEKNTRITEASSRAQLQADHRGDGEEKSQSPTRKVAASETNNPNIEEDDEEAHLCDLHFISNCQSCQSWDRQQGDSNLQNKKLDDDDDDANDKGWMSHALSFEKDRLGKDLTWRKKNEEELVVIDPREKDKEIKEAWRKDVAAAGSGGGGKGGFGSGRERDRKGERGGRRDRR